MTKVSVIVPVCNVEKYLAQCLDSLLSGVLRDIEVICVDDGSTDSSPAILASYAERDGRVRVITKENRGYGHTVNVGLDAAVGEYVGILESDDFAHPEMLTKLYTLASDNALDICKGGFYYYFSTPKERSIPSPVPKKCITGRVFAPICRFKNPRRRAELFGAKPTVWSAIYKREFLLSHGIRFNETPGASYQDLAFSFKVLALAERYLEIPDPLVYYRQDNDTASVRSSGKVYCVMDEYREIEAFLDREGLHGELDAVVSVMKFSTYMWNYERLTAEAALEFLLAASEELKRDMREGRCIREAFSLYKWHTLKLVTESPAEFHRIRQEERLREKYVHESERGGGIITRGFRSLAKNGPVYTLRKLLSRLSGRGRK